jgi:hypothetical protein
MKRIIRSLLLATAVATLTASLTAYAADGAAPAKKEAGAKAKPATTPMKGKIDAVDGSAKTITVGTRTFAVTSTTKIMKEGQPAVFADAKVGEEVGGAYKTAADGKLELTSLRIGPKPAAADKPPKEKSNDKAAK